MNSSPRVIAARNVAPVSPTGTHRRRLVGVTRSRRTHLLIGAVSGVDRHCRVVAATLVHPGRSGPVTTTFDLLPIAGAPALPGRSLRRPGGACVPTTYPAADPDCCRPARPERRSDCRQSRREPLLLSRVTGSTVIRHHRNLHHRPGMGRIPAGCPGSSVRPCRRQPGHLHRARTCCRGAGWPGTYSSVKCRPPTRPARRDRARRSVPRDRGGRTGPISRGPRGARVHACTAS